MNPLPLTVGQILEESIRSRAQQSPALWRHSPGRPRREAEPPGCSSCAGLSCERERPDRSARQQHDDEQSQTDSQSELFNMADDGPQREELNEARGGTERERPPHPNPYG